MKNRSAKKDFWNGKNYAVVGVSRKKHKFGNTLFKEMKKKAFSVFPVNNNMERFEDEPCFPDLREITVKLDGVLVAVSPESALEIIRKCVNLGIRRV